MRIEVYYNGIKNANNAVEKLKSAGFSSATVDLNDDYIDLNNSSSGLGAGMNFSNVINSEGFTRNSSQKVVVSGSPMSGGFGNSKEIEDTGYKVIINSDLLDSQRLKEVIRETGGQIKNFV
ncbi:hypothetical protein [Clostridium luticellarii]|uniref:Uncharacterized protein n=1 Tax=Clostridium luticellarii TaxID=1691940 RepID=A0A2T0BCD6_9CLOT|nr:hypothetical protein [Clostridium luticellarii]MCI1944183.1 hypothetical protein [Clostridium luticellarii]MCI1967685.1 hypothetical protein [Clostridium luticellarii]MCI1994866.1 hypothetical protein [Clostridium luticellarii]MCI2039649.1 hypothetical protein [Clostridium luticellarii]PRR81548.1 hypothetical protein CLLU_31050 [Clostridium luticellarii]